MVSLDPTRSHPAEPFNRSSLVSTDASRRQRYSHRAPPAKRQRSNRTDGHCATHSLRGWLGLSVILAQIALCSIGSAQEQRFELGLRVVALERDWLATADRGRQRQALPRVIEAVQGFFSMQPLRACQRLDQARRQLRKEPLCFADSLAIRPQRFVIEKSQPTLQFEISRCYPFVDSTEDRKDADSSEPGSNDDNSNEPDSVEDPLPLFVDIRSGTQTSTFTVANALPQIVQLSTAGWECGDREFHFSFRSSRPPESLKQREFHYQVAVISEGQQLRLRLQEQLEELDERLAKTSDIGALHHLRATVRGVLRYWEFLNLGGIPEQRVALHQQLQLCEASLQEVLSAVAQPSPWQTVRHPGDSWLTLELESGSVPLRVQVPRRATDSPWPVVVALHGAGGNEHLFFEGYGAGALTKICARENWLLVSPRVSPLSRLSLAQLLDALDDLFPIHPEQCLLLGHSMGAMTAIAQARQHPTRVTALALLSGGGNPGADVRKLSQIPIYIAAGEEDFGQVPAKRIFDLLQRAGHPKLRYEEILATEHLLMVGAALPQVAEFFKHAVANTEDKSP